MTLLAFVFLLAFLPAESASSRYLPKAASNPVFGPRQVYGLLKGSVTVKCFYPPTSVNRHDRKYWCKESATGCTTIVSTSGFTAPGYQGRVSITDYPLAQSFQINMTGLTEAEEGTYQCGVGINGRGLSHKVILEVSQGPHVPEGAELFYVKLHSTLTVSCSFGPNFASMRKYLCKMEKSGCQNVVDTYQKFGEDYVGRVRLSNEVDPGSFSVTITQIGWEDSGLYMCGAGVYGESGESKELDVHVYEDTKVPQGKPTIFGVKGSSVTFECRYEPLRKLSMKTWCKWRDNRCPTIIDSSGFVLPLYEGRVAMYNNPHNNTYTVILNQLKDSDKGYYWCLSDEVKEQQSSTELKIIDGQPGLEGKKNVEAQVGSRVDLTCSYSCKYYSYQKYWCKWNNTGCILMPSSDQRRPGTDVTCDTDNKTVILSFDSVTKADQGWYWCGVKRNGIFGETMAVYLEVTGGELQGKGRQGLSCSSGLRGDTPSHAEPGFIPKGKSFSEAGVRSAAASESSDPSHGPNKLILILGPIGAALLILVAAFAVFKYRQLKRSDLVSVGSYRTNISMSDFETVKEYGASNNTCVQESQETQMGGDEFITTTGPPESAAETKKAKRSSKEDADLAYSAFLLTSSGIVQGGPGGDGAAPDGPPPNWEGKI
ncbi:PIGR protein, partial [Glareola pratincola]|nr:PIGR protein [Glareola pratincola]